MLSFQSVSKSFPGVNALQDVSFDVRQGTVHALCGENGAGKSTLLKLLSGVYRPDSGNIVLDGQALHFSEPHDAIRAGVSVIYQELHLVPEMTVAENLFLGMMPSQAGIVNRVELRSSAASLLRRIGLEIEPDARVGSLSLAQRQMVEIGKALCRDARVIAFDEPTSSLSIKETSRLFEIIRTLREAGKIILYVSHRMDEIENLCDACTVLRDGRHVETFPEMEGVSTDLIVQRMVGRAIEDVWGYAPRDRGEPVLRVSGLLAPGLRQPVSFEVGAGEIVGIFGLVGAGRTELLKAIYGASIVAEGSAEVGASPLARSPRESIDSGVALCPEDRKHEALLPLRSVKENINLSARAKHARLGFVDERWERTNAERQIDRLSVRTPSAGQPVGLLSGGNQQKTVLARWLSEPVKAILLDEPTRGVDVGAKREIYDILFELARSGVAVLFVSSDLPEVLGVADRILVMRQGSISGELMREEASEEAVLRLALPVADTVQV